MSEKPESDWSEPVTAVCALLLLIATGIAIPVGCGLVARAFWGAGL